MFSVEPGSVSDGLRPHESRTRNVCGLRISLRGSIVVLFFFEGGFAVSPQIAGAGGVNSPFPKELTPRQSSKQ